MDFSGYFAYNSNNWEIIVREDGMKHLIWDWNGTLLADAALSCEISSSMLVRRGKAPLPLERFVSIMGCPYEEAYRKAGFDYAKEPYAALALEWAEEYARRWKEASLRSEAKETLGWIRDRGLTQSLLTASREDLAREQLDWFGLTPYFSLITGVDDDLAEGKEHLAQHHAQKLGLAPEDMLLVGDTENDVLTARAIGCPAILISGGHMDDARLIASGLPVLPDLASLRLELERRLA